MYVGIVTFDADVETALEPTQDRSDAKAIIDGLELARQTRLNDGVIQAVEVAGTEGQRRLLVLSDGKDTSKTPESDVTEAIEDAEVTVDVVALDQSGSSLLPLKAMSDAGNGSIISADADALAAAFSDEAAALARQVLVTATLPDSVAGDEATVTVTAPIDGKTATASTYAVIRSADDGPTLSGSGSDDPAFAVPKPVMFGGLIAIGFGILVLVASVMGMRSGRSGNSVEDRILAYGAGGPAHAAARPESAPALDQAKDAAAKMLHRNRGLESRISNRLEAAGSAFKPAEWLLGHAAIALAAGLAGLLLGGGGVFMMLLGLALGIVIPWIWLGFKRKRRVKRFNAGLADTLQLMSGSLSAGLSLAQSVDTVVREGNDPIAGEFKRVLIETRLGVSLEEAMASVAERMGSKDFEWVVMAIGIQRQVGGNLAELLNTVAGTLRERDYLRRQVASSRPKASSPAYILGGMPIAMLVYMQLVRPDYVEPLFTTTAGLASWPRRRSSCCSAASSMSRIVKVEV